MIIDSHSLEKESVVESDLCIIGGGAAGISIALEFLNAGRSVSVLVSGGIDPDGETQSLSDGESVGGRYFPPMAAAVRCLGGNTSHWGSWSRPFDDLDFEKREWVPHSGWPITRADLDPFYARAHTLLKLAPGGFGCDEVLASVGDPKFCKVSLDTPQLETKVWKFQKPPVCFGRDHRAELEGSTDVMVYLHANVIDLEMTENGAEVTGAVASTIEGSRLYFRAKRFVLAAGGLQNPRILLASNKVQKRGIGNDHDVVGRYFMDHPHLHQNGIVILRDIGAYPELYDTNSQYTRKVVGGFCPSSDFQRSERIMNCAINFKPSHRNVAGTDAHDGWTERIGAMMDDLSAYPGKIYRGIKKRLGYRGIAAPPRRFLDVITRCEQAPNPESRVLLGEQKDRLGVPKVKIDWRVTGLDRRTMIRAHTTLAAAFGAINFGRYKVEILPRELDDAAPWDTSGEEGRFEGGWHHMGTTRMCDDPKFGVVDRNCKVHGVLNLYVAGSSVFPTSSAFNPTMTLVALALRLADHLKVR